MKIDRVTITGADDKTDIEELKRLSEKYPFVEWGILFSESRRGQQRYPGSVWVNNFMKAKLKSSAHFCGKFSREVIENKYFGNVSVTSLSFERIQLNYSFANGQGYNLGHLAAYARMKPEVEFILQLNKGNNPILKSYLKSIPSPPPNIHFLYDSSGGHGSVIREILPSIPGHYTGYAGGINPENVFEICVFINDNFNDEKVYIDLESGVRTNNEFDLRKVELILNITQSFI